MPEPSLSFSMPARKRFWVRIGLGALRRKERVRAGGFSEGDPLTPKRILYFEFTRAGDLICATPFLSILREHWPDVKVSLAVYEEVREAATGLPGVDRVVTFDRKKPVDAARRLWRMRRASDTLVLSHGINPLVAFYFQVTDAPAFAGYLWDRTFVKKPGRPLEFPSVETPFGHLVDQRLEIGKALGLSTGTAPPPQYEVREDAVGAEVRAALGDVANRKVRGESIVVLSPGSRLLSKKWPDSHFLELSKRLLAEMRISLIVTGGPEEQELAERMKGLAADRVFNLTGKTRFQEFAAVVRASDLVVCNDSAALHLAAAFRVPCVALFGPVPPGNVVHRFPGYRTVGLTGTEPCACGYDVFREPVCTHDRQCLRSLAPDQVARAAFSLLQRST